MGLAQRSLLGGALALAMVTALLQLEVFFWLQRIEHRVATLPRPAPPIVCPPPQVALPPPDPLALRPAASPSKRPSAIPPKAPSLARKADRCAGSLDPLCGIDPNK